MKSLLISAVALAALSSTALAADLGSRRMDPIAPVIMPLPMFTWAGFYAGVHAGGVFANSDVTTRGTAGNTITNVDLSRRPGSLDGSRNGFIGGGQIGYNWQVGQFVYGVEADISYTDANSTRSFIGTTNARSVIRHELDYLGTVRLRAGYAFDRFLVYATGGLAYGDVNRSATFFAATPSTQVDYVGSKSGVKAGYAVGAGVEYAFTDNLTLRGEYLYYDLGRTSVNVVRQPLAPAGGQYVSRFRTDGHIVRAGLNYKF